jgi:hypothetical protein
MPLIGSTDRDYADDSQGVTLHAEMVDILSESGGDGLAYQAIADLVNARGVYRKRNGSAVEASQVKLRARNYAKLFEDTDGRVRLRSLTP